MLSRRQFLAAAGGVVAAGAAGSATWAALTNLGEGGSTGAHPAFTPSSTTVPGTVTTAAGTADRVLVVVQLQGGNDGLNTLVPLDGRYHDARPNLAIPADGKLVKFPGTEAFGLHPALAPLTGLLTGGHVAAFESIGYQRPDRSHFAALDAWWSGTPGQASSTGWLGRYLDVAVPSAGGEPLFAVALGGGTPALAADHVSPTVVFSPAAFRLQVPRGVNRAALIDGWKASGGDCSRPASSISESFTWP